MALSAQVLEGRQNIQSLNNNVTSYQNITAPPEFDFAGFRSKHSFAVYNEIVDRLMYRITEAEFKALCYIVRRTCGFNKTEDAISFAQFTDGLRKRDGTWLDHGTGLSKPSICKALSGLQEKGIIWIEKQMGYKGGQQASVYGLVYEERVELNPKQDVLQQQDYSSVEYLQDKIPQNEANIAEHDYPVRNLNQGVVKNVNHLRGGSKKSLPPTKPVTYDNIGSDSLRGGKKSLPGVGKNVAGDSKNGILELVKNVNPQYDMKQNLDKQNISNMPPAQISVVNVGRGEGNNVSEKDILLEEIYNELKSFGLEDRMILGMIDRYEPEYLLEKIRLVYQRLRRENLSNPTGFLLRAIEDNYRHKSAIGSQVGGNFAAAQALLSRLNTDATNEMPESDLYDATNPPTISNRKQITVNNARDISHNTGGRQEYQKSPSKESVTMPLDETDLYENLVRQLSGPLGRPELLEHLQTAHFELTATQEAYLLYIHLKESWRARFFSQSGVKTLELALGRYFGVGCKVQLVTRP